MTELQVINIIRDAVVRQLPKTCKSCGFQFNSLKEYLQIRRTMEDHTPVMPN